MNGTIKNIIFDLGEVLITGVKDTGIALRERHQLEVGGSIMDWATEKHPLLTPLVKEFFHGNVSEDAYVDDVVKKYPQVGNAHWLKSHIRENFREVEGTREIVVRLRELGYRLAILSNHGKEWIEYSEKKFDFQNLFDVCVYSHEIGASKPDSRAFEAVLDKLGAEAQECLFIDDSPVNIAGAQKLGFNTILFEDAEALKKELAHMLSDF